MSKPLGAYIHIPFCHARCRYCDFFTRAGSRSVPQEYVQALLQEITKLTAVGERPDTLYFGGGTPGLLSPIQVSSLIEAVNPQQGAEITLECNPELVTPELLRDFAKAGVNRISFGVQSADNAQLRRLGRLHTAEDAKKALAWAGEAGFAEICGDIMLALPEYTNAEFDRTLALLKQGGCTHISAYLLKIEEGTAFAKHPPEGLPNADEAADFYLYAVKRLEKEGFRQYEISNFARAGHEGRHNLHYWRCEDYWGIGPAAHSCRNGVRRFWESDTAAFIAGTLTEQEEGICDGEDYLLMCLRLTEGLNLDEYARRYGVVWGKDKLDFVEQCVRHGYAKFENHVLSLTPAGMIVQNSILAELM